MFGSSITTFSQQAAYTDPAQAYLKVVLDNQSNPNEYTRVGSFNVKGTQMLYGGRQSGSVFTKTEKGINVNINYNTYNQQLEIFQNSAQPIIKQCNEVDSFHLVASIKEVSIKLHFYNAALFDANNCFFLQEIVVGERFSLYKKYSSDLGYISTNYIEPGLRQFDLKYEYYYYDKTTKELRKFKHSINAITKEFKKYKDVSSALDPETFNFNPETALINVFSILNS